MKAKQLMLFTEMILNVRIIQHTYMLHDNMQSFWMLKLVIHTVTLRCKNLRHQVALVPTIC